LDVYRPQQIEFAPLNLSYTVLSKRMLRELVEGGYVNSWDDPRMPTISGLRRRGFTPASIRDFASRVGIAKREGVADVGLLEYCLRQDLNIHAERRMAVLDPLKVVIKNYPEGESEELEAINNPEYESAGKRMVPFSRELYIEREDFREDPPKKFFRLAPGREVRLRYAYFLKCEEVVKDSSGEIIELHCIYDPETKGGSAPDGRKVRGTIHWVSAQHAVSLEIRLYDRLFCSSKPGSESGDFKADINPNSLETLKDCKLEPNLNDARAGEHFQFERVGYFYVDPLDSREGSPIFNRTVTLRDKWTKIEKSGK